MANSVIAPWNDRNRKFSPLKALTLAALIVPALWFYREAASGDFGMTPLGEMTFWSGILSMGVMLAALAVTPAAAILHWPRLVIVRRMIEIGRAHV